MTFLAGRVIRDFVFPNCPYDKKCLKDITVDEGYRFTGKVTDNMNRKA